MPYSVRVNNKIYDVIFTKSVVPFSGVYFAKLNNHHIGSFHLLNGGWSVVVSREFIIPGRLPSVDGFKTRWKALEYLLAVTLFDFK